MHMNDTGHDTVGFWWSGTSIFCNGSVMDLCYAASSGSNEYTCGTLMCCITRHLCNTVVAEGSGVAAPAAGINKNELPANAGAQHILQLATVVFSVKRAFMNA